MSQFWQKLTRKENPSVYSDKDSNLKRILGTKEFLALGIGTMVSTSIFTLPGVIAAQYTGPAVVISYIVAAVIAAMIAFAYAEIASAMPFAGSAYSWVSALFGEFFGWAAGFALLAEYIMGIAFVALGLSANWRGLFEQFNLKLPTPLAKSFVNGGAIDLVAVLAIILVSALIARGTKDAARMQAILVVAKLLAIFLFLFVGATALHIDNWQPFIPKHTPNTHFGGMAGISAGVAGVFLSYLGFDAIAANAAEAKDPEKTMPRGILGSLGVAAVLFSLVSLVLVGMFSYAKYASNVEPVGWALRQAGHPAVAVIVSTIAVVGMFTALIGYIMAGSRLLYSLGRDGMLPKWVGKLTDAGLPNNGLLVTMITSIFFTEFFSFELLSQLITAGTLIAFVFVTLAIYRIRPREGKDIAQPGFKMPLYPFMPAVATLAAVWVFMNTEPQAKLYAALWMLLGIIIYFAYGMHHSVLAKPTEKQK